MSITVVTPTNRESNLSNIIQNFIRQNYEDKELIILLNYDNPKDDLWKKSIKDFNNINIYKLGSRISLGNSLNYGIDNANYDYIAKMDDDDFYGPKYLLNSLGTLLKYDADIVGKKSYYIYFEDKNILGLNNINYENRFVNRVAGSTLFFKREIYNFVQFKNINLGEDKEFCKDSITKGYKILSTDRNDYIYFRKNNRIHTWKIDNDYLIKKCIYIDKSPNLNEYMNKWQV